jgi:small glutamine-rich tetratricopeptide repeat-containing protein alpha
VKPHTLPSIFDVFLKTYNKLNTPAAESSSSTASASEPQGSSDADKAAAEKLKASGNSQMSAKQYDAAIDSYTKAIALDPKNAVYYSNRAAAHSSKNDHAAAIADAEKAIEVDPSFVRAYHRLG